MSDTCKFHPLYFHLTLIILLGDKNAFSFYAYERDETTGSGFRFLPDFFYCFRNGIFST
ncbi:hypothetical protein MTBPR1_30239 [Candidatus Terasakiella magnetica]|uniref:Uncharacterized protein n=1 Tax=Candidatus Terasakiella magnetica TaxID=1867952 RepID=A0A1C3RHW4_9PROT|nr:hypothetical protein MTBPR1_30239 [Candidatus Terasakiella magnetica]